MATIDSSNINSSSGGNTVSVSHTLGSGADTVIWTSTSEDSGGSRATDQPITSVTYNGVSCVIDGQQITSDNYANAAAGYILSASLPAAGTYNLVVTTTGNVLDLIATCQSWSGLVQAAPEASISSQSIAPASTTVSTNITTITNNALVIDVIADGNADTYTAGSGTIVRQATSGTTAHSTQYTVVATAGSTAISQVASATPNRYAHYLMAFEDSGGGGGSTIIPSVVHHFKNQGIA